MHSLISVNETPNGVLKRVAGNEIQAPHFFILNQSKITFGSSPLRDIVINTRQCPGMIATIRKITSNKNLWNVTNENADYLFVNELFLRRSCSINLKSGDTIRFKTASWDLIYSFQIYSQSNPPTPVEMKSFLEPKLKELEKNADTIHRNCIELKAELNKLSNITSNAEIRYPNGNFTSVCKAPMGAFEGVISNVIAPPIYFFNKHIVTFGTSTGCDVVIQSDECFPFEATVRKLYNWQITNHNANHSLFVNERYFEIGETLNLKSGDHIRFGGNVQLNLVYQFQLYSNAAFPTKIEAQKYFEIELKKWQEKAYEIDEACNKLKTKLTKEKLKLATEKIESEIRAAQKWKDVTDKEIKKASQYKTVVVKTEKVEASEVKIKTEPVDDFKNKSKTSVVKREKVDATEVKIKKEFPVEVIEID